MDAILRALIDGLMSIAFVDTLHDGDAQETIIGMMPTHGRDGLAHMHNNN